MSIVPRKKISIAKKKQRHSTWRKLQLKKLWAKYAVSKCVNCGSAKLSHRVCPECGYYKGKQVINIKPKEKVQVLEA